MKKRCCLVAVLIVFFVSLQACATAVQPLCTHRALYQALSFNQLTGQPVRIAIGPSDVGMHAQAQTERVDGKWEWLEQGDFGVSTGYKDTVPGFEPNRYVSVEQLLQRLGYFVTSRSPIKVKADTETLTSGDHSSSRSIYRDPLE